MNVWGVGGGGGVGVQYAISLLGCCRACMVFVIMISHIWVRIETNTFKEGRSFREGNSTRGDNQPRIKYSIGYHLSVWGCTTILYVK